MTHRYATLIGITLVLVGIQMIPVSFTNPRSTGEIEAPSEISNVLRTSCYDCHSNESVWPWYTRVAPASWLIARDVREARDELNFSEWRDYTDRRKGDKLEEVEEMITEGEMPLWFYLPLHRDARLSDAEKQALIEWSRAEREAIGYVPDED